MGFLLHLVLNTFPFLSHDIVVQSVLNRASKGGLQFNSKIGLQYTIEVTLFRLYLTLNSFKIIISYNEFIVTYVQMSKSLNYNKPSKYTTQANSLCCRTSNLLKINTAIFLLNFCLIKNMPFGYHWLLYPLNSWHLTLWTVLC